MSRQFSRPPSMQSYELGELLLAEVSKLRVNQNDQEMLSLIKEGADLSVCDDYGDTALHLAVSYDVPVVVQALLDAGADVNRGNAVGRTPLFNAIFNRGEDVLDILIHHPTIQIDQFCNGQTPLHVAAELGRVDKVSLLLRAGANPLLQDLNGHTPYDLAQKHKPQEKGHRKVMDFLDTWDAHQGDIEKIRKETHLKKISGATTKPLPRKKFKGFKPKR